MIVIETNISKDENNNTKDIQSRFVQIDNWEKYINMFYNYNGTHLGEYQSNMIGYSLPNNAEIIELEYNDIRIICKLKLFNGMITEKLAYNTKIDTLGWL